MRPSKLLSVTLLLVLCSVFVGTETIALAEEREPVTLTLYNIWGGSRIPLMEEQLRRFEEKYPWITVQNQVGGHDLIEEQALVAIASGAPPDVLMIDRLNIPAFVEGGYIQPLDPFIAKSDLDLSIFYDSEIQSCQYKGKTYTLPLPTASLSLLYYNRALFAESGLDPNQPPETWDQMAQYAKRIQRISADGTVEICGASINYFPRHRLAQLAYCNGATIFGEDGLSFNYLEPEVHETARWVADFVSSVPIGGNFQEGTRAMETNGEWVFFYIKKGNPNLDFGMGLVPHGPQGEYRNVVAAAWSYGIPAGVKHPYESWLLVEFLTTSEEGAKYFTFEQARPSPVREFTQDPAYFDINPYWDVIGQALERSVSIPPSPVARKVIDADVHWYNQIINGVESPQSALTKLQEQIEGIMKDYELSANK